jgi:hypothetical protein
VLREPRVTVTLGLAVGVVAGFAMISRAYAGVAPLLFVPKQVPWIVSGGIGGLCVLGAALLALRTHIERVESSQERRELAEVQRRVLLILQKIERQSS